jgi:circadian clock protein KaiA
VTVASAPVISICGLVTDTELATNLGRVLAAEQFQWRVFEQEDAFLAFLRQPNEVHCLFLEATPQLAALLSQLHQGMTFLPALIIALPSSTGATQPSVPTGPTFYHVAEVHVHVPESAQITLPDLPIERAIRQFLEVIVTSPAPVLAQATRLHPELADSFVRRQQELSLKLKERLGYFGVFYKRDPQNYFRQLSTSDQQALLADLKIDYRDVVLNYFTGSTETNQKIDALVTRAFFADLSVSQMLEIHMELMDNFAKQLKLEGRSEDILLDYRLTLIDVISHLCEMYRRSLPRAVTPSEVTP